MKGRIMVYYENPDSSIITGAILPVNYEKDFKAACAAALLNWANNEALKAFESDNGLEESEYDFADYAKVFKDYQCRSECSYEVLEDGV